MKIQSIALLGFILAAPLFATEETTVIKHSDGSAYVQIDGSVAGILYDTLTSVAETSGRFESFDSFYRRGENLTCFKWVWFNSAVTPTTYKCVQTVNQRGHTMNL